MDLLGQIAAFLGSVKTSVLLAWLLMVLLAAAIALAASGRPRRPFRKWVGDYLVRWGLSGLFLWFVVFGLWAMREVLAQNFIFPIWPLEGFIENATLWGVVLTGFLTLAFFGGTLFLQAIFAAPEVELPPGSVYYKREVLIVGQREEAAGARETYLSIPADAPELREEKTARREAAERRA